MGAVADTPCYVFGHAVVAVDRRWHFKDTGERVRYTGKGGSVDDRECPKCHKKRTAEGHDPCIGHLPGVQSACCGHGVEPGYICFLNGTCVRFHSIEVD